MKHVFVETNFLIDVARPFPEVAAERLFSRSGDDVILHIPWCAVTEARRTLDRIITSDLGFDKAMLKFATRELRHSGKREEHAAINAFGKRVREERQLAKAGIDARISDLVQSLQIIPPSSDVVEETLRVWEVKSLPPFDEMVLGAVIAKATELHQSGERELFFCNLNKNDFSPLDRGGMTISLPDLAGAYRKCGLTYLDSFDVPF